jgi:predicted metal-dependent enzyme (double-stranded beta helix superfamily)
MFDIDEFLTECVAARGETEPRLALREVLDRALRRPGDLGDTLPDLGPAGLSVLHAADDLTVAHVVWAPGMHFRPHNHETWACIGIFSGQEDNTFFRREGEGLVTSGGKAVRTGDVALLGDDTIHAVTNPLAVSTGAIHVYGGNIVTREGRSEWVEPSLDEIDYEFHHVHSTFESYANQAVA